MSLGGPVEENQGISQAYAVFLEWILYLNSETSSRIPVISLHIYH